MIYFSIPILFSKNLNIYFINIDEAYFIHISINFLYIKLRLNIKTR